MSYYATSGSSKVFEVPDTDQYLAVLADVVDLGVMAQEYAGEIKMKAMVRLVWILAKKDGSGYAVDSEGIPFKVIRQMPAVITETPKASNLFKTLFAITGTPPSVADDIEGLIGRSNLLYIKKATSKKGKLFGEVVDISALPPGAPVIPIPKDFIRSKDKPVQTAQTGQVQNSGSGVPKAQVPQAAPAAFGQSTPATGFGGVSVPPKADVNFNAVPATSNSGF